jgi:peptidoglycan/LPS O-acetylase OafA/YrhL
VTATIAAVSGPTLSSSFDPRRNALNLLRLVLAAAVIFGHAALLGGYQLPGPVMLAVSELAVDGFFAISGFLIARSWLLHPDWRRYLWHRGLRILPGFWVCLTVTAFVIAPVAMLLRGESLSGFWLAADGPFGYVWRNSLLWIAQPDIVGGPDWSGYPGYWNGSLWSLYWEFLCYLGLGLLGALGVLRRRRWLVLVAFVAVWLLTAVKNLVPGMDAEYFGSFNGQVIPRLALMFLAGCVLFLYAEYVPLNGPLAAAAALLTVAGLTSGLDLRLVGGLPLAYLLLWSACALPYRWGLRTDISYGVYIYAFPIQQTLFAAGLAAVGWLGYALLATTLTVPLAYASWRAVEHPALRLKSRAPGGPPRARPGQGALAMGALFGLFAMLMLLAPGS